MKEKSVRLVVFGLVLVLLASGIGTVSAFSNSGDGDWKYYKEITVKENSGKTLTDFQVLIELNSTSFDFSKAKSDGSDIRFTDERGNTQSSLFFVDFAQHSATDSGDFVILTNDGRVYEVDPLHLSDIQLRTSAGPVNVAAVIPDLYDDSILAFTEDGKLYQCKDSENWANWNKVGDINLPSGSKMVDFAQHSAADSGDFVILTNDGKVYEVDPRHLSDIQLRTSTGPFNVAKVISDRYDNSILAVTSDGFLYRATTDDDWNSWAQVGRVQLSGGSKIVGFAQHSAVTTGDFVFLTDDGKVYEVDPRRLSIFEFRTANGPSNVVAIKPNTYDNSILAVTSEGFIYRATTDDDWNAWTEVGRIHSPVKPKNELNYWIEEWDAGAKEAKIWVKVPSIPANGETKIRMYYGNPSASAVSDGDKVFEFFDDFSRKSLDTDKWIIFGNPKMTFSNSILDISGSCGAENANGDVLESKKNFNYPLIYEAYYKYDHTPWGNYAGIGLGRYSYPVSTHCAMEVDNSCYDNKGAFEIENGDSVDGCEDWIVNDWEKTKIVWTDKFVSFERGSAICTFTSSIPSQSMPVHLGDSYFNRNEFIQLYVDWIFIHKYASIEPTLTLSAECPTTAPTLASPYVYYEEDFETNPGYTSLAPKYAYWDYEQGNYYVKTYDNLAHKYWAYSPKFQTVDTNPDIIVELDVKCENLDWGTYPGAAFYYDNQDIIEGYVFRVEFHWDDPYGKNLVIADSYKHTHWANAPPRSNVWYHVKLKYHASTQKLDIYITEKSTGESFFIKENADFRIDPFCYLGMGYYNEPDYGNEWSPIRVNNIRIAAIGKLPALTPTPTSTPPAPSPTPVSQEHIKFIVTPLGDGKYNITYTEYAPFTVKILRYSDGKGIAGVPLYQLEPKEIIEASKEYLQQNAPNIIGTQLTERAVTKILEEAGVYVFSGPFGIIITVFSNLATAVDYLSYLTTPYIDLGAITDNEGKATLYLPNRAYTTTRDMSAFITQTQEPIDQTAPATQEQIAEQIASIILPTIQEELQPIARTDVTVAIPTKITIDDKGVITTETAEELKTYTEFRAINSKAVGNSRELTFWVEPRVIPPATIGTGEGEEEKMMKAHVLSQNRSLFPHVVSLSHYFQNKGINCGYIDLIGHLADINEWVALNSPLESRWPSPEDDFTVVISSKQDNPKWKQTIKQFPQETVLQGSGWEVTKYTQTSADISGEHERFIFSIVVTDDEKREEAIKAFIENADQLGMPIEKEKEIPGFEVVFAIAGLLAVAYVLRRKK